MRRSGQSAAVVDLLADVFGDALVGAWLHGSAVLDTLRPSSDLDVLAVVDPAPDAAQRMALLERLLAVSAHPDRAVPGRPVELTVVARGDVVPWRYPPCVAFQYGEWLRDEYERGVVPDRATSSDLALLVEVARRGAGSLVGPPPRDVLPEVPREHVLRAAVDAVPELLQEVDTDTRNVVLTLARVLTTLETGTITTKDRAADHLLTVVPRAHRTVLVAARDDYLGVAAADWSAHRAQAKDLAAWVEARVARSAVPERVARSEVSQP